MAGLSPYPVTESTLMLFIAHRHNEGLSPGTMKSYLAAVRHEQVSIGLGDPHIAQMPQLEYVLKGAKRLTTAGTRKRLLITPTILRQIKKVWEESVVNQDFKMLWAASCLCFFGFLRSGEVTMPSERDHNPGVHLCFGDVRLDSHKSPSMLEVVIKCSKTDPFRLGVSLYIGATSTELCPVAAVIDYMLARGNKEGPLFSWQNGHFLTRQRFVKAVREVLTGAGLQALDYAGHSFRIGAATTAAQCGLPESTIKMLGRWQSSAYMLYIRTPKETLSNVAKVLASR